MTAAVAGLAVAAAVLLGSGRSRQRARVRAPHAAAAVGAVVVAGAVVTALLACGLAPASAVGCAAGATVGGCLWRRRADRQLAARRRQEVIAFVHALAGELRAGRPPGAAIAAAAAQLETLAAALTRVGQAAQLGSAVAVDLRTVAELRGADRLASVAAVWEVLTATGARVADVLDELATAFAAEDEQAAELAALLAGPRATVVVLAALPGAALLLGSGIGAHPLRMLLHTAPGAAALAAAAVLDAVGLLWMRAVVGRAVAPVR